MLYIGQVYCEMGLNGGGYTFINPHDLPTLTNDEVQAMFTDRTNFLMRVQRNNSTQPYGVLQQLDQFAYELDSSFIYVRLTNNFTYLLINLITYLLTSFCVLK